MNFGLIAVLVMCGIGVVFLVLIFRNLGYRQGLRDGHTLGRKEADDWWIGAEADVSSVRRDMGKGAKR